MAEALQKFPDDPGPWIEHARIAHTRRDLAEAIKRWDTVRTRFPHHPAGYSGAAHSLGEAGRSEEAERVLQSAVARFPHDAAPAIDLAWLAHHRQDWPEAIRRWQQVQQRFPEHPAGYTGLAQALVADGRSTEAEAALLTASQRFPDDARPLTAYARIAQQRRDWAEAARRWEDVRTRFPAQPASLASLAEVQLELGHIDAAEAVLREAMTAFPTEPALLVDYAEAAMRRGDGAEALSRWRTAKARFPNDANIDRNIADLSARLERPKTAPAKPDLAQTTIVDAAVNAGDDRMTTDGSAQKMIEKKYLIFASTPVGLGHLFTALLNCAYYAHRTKRALALDMREFIYFKSDRQARFLENFAFEFPDDLEIITDLDEIDRLKGSEDLHPVTIDDRLDINKPFPQRVLYVPCIGPGEPYSIDTKAVTHGFKVMLRGMLLDEWQRVMQMPQWQGHVVGMHFRALIGEIGPRMNREIVPDFEERYARLRNDYIQAALSIVQQAGYSDASFLVASDDATFVSYIKERLPGAFSIATHLPDRDCMAYVRAYDHDVSILVDAVNDLWCLSACDHLVLSGRSGFSQFAILNSLKLSRATAHYMDVPLFGDLLETLEPHEALQWAKAAVRKIDANRMRLAYLYEAYAAAAARAGATDEEESARRRGRWYWETTASPVVDIPERSVFAGLPRGEYAGVIAFLRRAASQLPDNPYVLAGYGDSLSNVLAMQGNIDEAIVVARRAIELEPRDPYLHSHLGKLLAATGASDDAERALRRAIDLDPQVPTFYDDLSRFLGLAGRWSDAVAAARNAVIVDPKSARWHGRLGETLLQANHFDEAALALRQAVELGGNSGGYRHALAVALDREGKTEDAVEVVREARDLEPDQPHWHALLGEMLLRAGRFAEAETELRQSIILNGDNPNYHHVLSIVLERQQQLDAAIQEARLAAELDKEQPGRSVRVAELLLRSEHHEEAGSLLQDAAVRWPDHQAIHHLLSVSFERRGRVDDAIAEADAAARTDPRFHGRVGELLARAGRLPEAEIALRKATAYNDADVGLHHLLGIVLERQNRPLEAAHEAVRAFALASDNVELARRAGLLLSNTLASHVRRLQEIEQPLRDAAMRVPPSSGDVEALNLLLQSMEELDQAVVHLQAAAATIARPAPALAEPAAATSS
ncbi:MAG TPA: tetratricopeptide repeat protein [Acetobacteraceae bacterium]